MDKAIIDELRAEGNRGIEAAKRSRADLASIHFTNALNRAEQLRDKRTRRDELAALAGVFELSGFPDLALTAAEAAVDLDRELGLTNLMAQDIVSVGNAHLYMENTVKAEACYRQALAVFLDQDDFANAASATTNIAGIVANRGDMPQAIDLLETSLQYLKREPFDDTELETRFRLLQALEFEKRDVKRAIDNARELCARFFENMPDVQRTVTRDFVGRAIDRYVAAYPKAGAAWKAKNFPTLYS